MKLIVLFIVIISLFILPTYCNTDEQMHAILEQIKTLQNNPNAMNMAAEELTKLLNENQKVWKNGKQKEVFPVKGTIIRNGPIIRDKDSL